MMILGIFVCLLIKNRTTSSYEHNKKEQNKMGNIDDVSQACQAERSFVLENGNEGVLFHLCT